MLVIAWQPRGSRPLRPEHTRCDHCAAVAVCVAGPVSCHIATCTMQPHSLSSSQPAYALHVGCLSKSLLGLLLWASSKLAGGVLCPLCMQLPQQLIQSCCLQVGGAVEHLALRDEPGQVHDGPHGVIGAPAAIYQGQQAAAGVAQHTSACLVGQGHNEEGKKQQAAKPTQASRCEPAIMPPRDSTQVSAKLHGRHL